MDSSLSNIWQKIINFKLTVFEFLTFKNIGMYQTQFVKSTVFLKLTHLPIKEQHMLYFVLKKKKSFLIFMVLRGHSVFSSLPQRSFL